MKEMCLFCASEDDYDDEKREAGVLCVSLGERFKLKLCVGDRFS